MTPIEQLHDEIMGLTAQLEGKRLELALAQGDTTGVHLFKESMYRAIKARVGYRAAITDVQTVEQGSTN